MDALGVKDADIARKTGISTSALSRYRAGGSPKAEHLFALADALKCSPRWLITGSEDDPVAGRGIIALPVAVGTEASAGGGAVPLDYEEVEPVPFPEKWLRGLGDPKNMALIRVSGDSMSPKILHGDMVIFDRTRRGPGDGVYLIRHEGTLMVKQVCFFDAEIRIRSENKHWPEVPVPYSAMEDAGLFEVIGRVVWAGRLLTAAGD